MKIEKGNGLRNNRKGSKARRTLKYLHLRFIRLRGQPHEVALGVALGVFAGSMPIMPFQTAFAVFLALAFKGSKIAAALGTWISNPLNWYFLYYFSYKIGARIIGLPGTHKVFHSLLEALHQGERGWIIFQKMANAGGGVMVAFLLGGLVLGTVFSIPSYFISLSMIRHFRAYRARKQRSLSCPEEHP